MKYLSEINAFYDSLETNRLNANDIALWHALISVANKTNWQSEFTVAIMVLEIKSGLNRQSVFRARNKLRDCKYISFRQRGGNQSAMYTINSLVYHTDTQSDTQSDTQGDTQGDTQSDTINRLEEKRLEKEKKTKAKKDFESLLDDKGFSDELKTAIYDWLRYKSERGESYKNTGLTKLVSEIATTSANHGERGIISVISKSMANNYAGFQWAMRDLPEMPKSDSSKYGGDLI